MAEKEKIHHFMDTVAGPEYVIEGYQPAADEPVYWRFIRGEYIPQEILDQDPVYRLMRKTVSEKEGEEK